MTMFRIKIHEHELCGKVPFVQSSIPEKHIAPNVRKKQMNIIENSPDRTFAPNFSTTKAL